MLNQPAPRTTLGKPVVVATPIRSAGVGNALKTAFIAPRDQATIDFQALLDRLD